MHNGILLRSQPFEAATKIMVTGWNSVMGKFRMIAIAEGISYLVLLFVAMPLKYFAGYPSAVKYTGWLHGLLFVLFGLLLIQVWIKYRWRFVQVLLAFIASLLPFGTFILDHKLKKQYFRAVD